MMEIKYEKTPIEGIGRCGMCKNITFCEGQLGITKSISTECMFNPSQFKPRHGFAHNEDCYFYHRGDRYSSELCCWDANDNFNCITCDKFIRKDEANKAIKNYILEKNSNNTDVNEKIDSMNRQIAHYDEELTEARKCIDDINGFCDIVLPKLEHETESATFCSISLPEEIISHIKDIISKYYISSNSYSDENVKCLIEGPDIEAEDIQMNDNAKIVTIQSMEEYI